MDQNEREELARKNQRMALSVLLIVIAMLGLSFASAPLYDMFCRVTGFGGTTQVSDTAPSPDQVLERSLRIDFVTSTARGMPWQFGAEQRRLNVNIGQDALINFKARNPTDEPITGTAIYNVSPAKAGKYFHKTQCFCFDRQILTPGQTMNMPVVFYVDPSFDSDPDMDDVSVITLSYTFFKSDSDDLQNALNDLSEG